MFKIVRLNVKISKLRKLAIVEALYFLDLEILSIVFFGLRNSEHCIFWT